MRQFVAGHRAMLGIIGVAAFVLLFRSLSFADTPAAVEIAFLAAALIGLGVLVGSPYWKVVYRESPLRRAVTGITDLDERELALRDRANGLTYFLFVTVNIVLLALTWAMLRLHHLTIDAGVLPLVIIPYAAFAVTLPVIVLEWFEPSGWSQAELDEEEEA